MSRARSKGARLGQILALVVLGLHGCSGSSCRGCSEDPAKKAVEEEDDSEEEAAEDLTIPPGLDIEMLALGSKPRFYLRVARWEGLTYRAKLKTAGTFGIVGQQAIAGPSLTMNFMYVVLRGSADPLERRVDGGVQRLIEERAILQSAHLESDQIPAPDLALWNAHLENFGGSTMRQLVTETGAIESLTLELVAGEEPPPDLQKVTDEALDQQRHFPFRLPPIPVGVGAQWRFKENITINGVAAVQSATMVLRSADDDTAKIRVTVRLQALRQSVPHPFEPGATAMLDVFRGDGDGEITVDRLTGIPLRGRLGTTARLTLSGKVAGQPAQATLLGSNVTILEAEILEGEGDAAAPLGDEDGGH